MKDFRQKLLDKKFPTPSRTFVAGFIRIGVGCEFSTPLFIGWIGNACALYPCNCSLDQGTVSFGTQGTYHRLRRKRNIYKNRGAAFSRHPFCSSLSPRRMSCFIEAHEKRAFLYEAKPTCADKSFFSRFALTKYSPRSMLTTIRLIR